MVFLPSSSHCSSIRIWAFSYNKVASPTNFEFSFNFLLFFMFLSSTCYSMWLCHRTMIDLFVGFHMGYSNGKIVLIRQISHIKNMFVNDGV